MNNASIGLNMIVKNEAHCIEECLASVLPLIDWWVIVDTGSTDGTQDVIRQSLQGIPGELHERPWVNFGHNRSEALDLARESSFAFGNDYALLIDADEHLVGVPSQVHKAHFQSDMAESDGFYLTAEYGDLRYQRLMFVQLDRPWRWEGVVHETLMLANARTQHLPMPRLVIEHKGARSRDPETYRKDLELIRAELEKNPGDTRLTFYLAQSYRDAGDLIRARQWYIDRVNMGGWIQEVWYSKFQIAVMEERLDVSERIVQGAYLAAFQMLPHRIEPLVELARFERVNERYDLAQMFAVRACEQLDRLAVDKHAGWPPETDLFVDTSAYAWRCWDELAVSSYYVGDYHRGVEAARLALEVRPHDERLKANLGFFNHML